MQLFTTLFAIAVAATTVLAQVNTTDIPACVLACSTEAATEAGCSSFADVSCVCTSAAFQSDAQTCLAANCTTADQEAALQLQSAICGNATVNGTVTSAIASSVASAASSVASAASSAVASITSAAASAASSVKSAASSALASASASGSSAASSAASSKSAAGMVTVPLVGLPQLVAGGVAVLGAFIGAGLVL